MADDQDDESINADVERLSGPTVKKPFETPKLTVYGDIATLTRAVGRTGSGDGGHGMKIRTRP
jgi:hypothetical protein